MFTRSISGRVLVGSICVVSCGPAYAHGEELVFVFFGWLLSLLVVAIFASFIARRLWVTVMAVIGAFALVIVPMSLAEVLGTRYGYISNAAFFVVFLLLGLLPSLVGGVGIAFGLRAFASHRATNKRKRSHSDPGLGHIEEGCAAASAHLVNPMYAVAYAKTIGRDLEAVHSLIRTGQLSSYWHEGVLFVGQGKIDTPNPSLQGTRDEAARP